MKCPGQKLSQKKKRNGRDRMSEKSLLEDYFREKSFPAELPFPHRKEGQKIVSNSHMKPHSTQTLTEKINFQQHELKHR